MSLYVLDTDTLTLWLRGQARVCERVAAQDPADLCTSIVTIEEILRGWYTQIRRAKKDDQIARAYAALQQEHEAEAVHAGADRVCSSTG
jgi:tRNA(fMet)-specific endonuclease VapC